MYIYIYIYIYISQTIEPNYPMIYYPRIIPLLYIINNAHYISHISLSLYIYISHYILWLLSHYYPIRLPRYIPWFSRYSIRFSQVSSSHRAWRHFPASSSAFCAAASATASAPRSRHRLRRWRAKSQWAPNGGQVAWKNKLKHGWNWDFSGKKWDWELTIIINIWLYMVIIWLIYCYTVNNG